MPIPLAYLMNLMVALFMEQAVCKGSYQKMLRRRKFYNHQTGDLIVIIADALFSYLFTIMFKGYLPFVVGALVCITKKALENGRST